MIERQGVKHLLLVGGLLTFLGSCSDCDDGFMGLGPPAQGSDNITLRYDDDTPYDFAGVQIFVDGVEVGLTDDAGKYNHEFSKGAHEVRAFHRGTSLGAVIREQGFTASTLFIPMTGDLVRGTSLSIAQLEGDYLPQLGTSVLDIEVLGSAKLPVDIRKYSVVAQDSHSGSLAPITVTQYFQQGKAGQLSVADAPGLMGELEIFVNKIQLIVLGSDTDGAEFSAESLFFLGQHRLDVQLEAPPSALSVPVNDLDFRARLIGTQTQFEGTTDSTGHLQFLDLPTGTYDILVGTEDQGLFYNAAHALHISSGTTVGLVLLGLEDVLNGVSVVSSLVAESSLAFRAGADTDQERDLRLLGGGSEFTGPAGQIQVTGGARDEVVVAHAERSLPQGTLAVGLTFEVISEEYPNFVQEHSTYNDNWTVHVLGPEGQLLFSRVRNVNSQTTQDPVWIPGSNPGTTGLLADEIGVSELTATGPSTVYVVISTTNIGDSQIPTSVQASLSANDFQIKSVVVDSMLPNFSCGLHSHRKSSRSSQFSLPFEGGVNVTQRVLTMDLIGRPLSEAVTNVRVDIVAPGTTLSLSEVVNEAPSTNGRVRQLPGAKRDRWLLSVGSTTEQSSLLSAMDASLVEHFEYLVTVQVGTGGQAFGDGGGGALFAEKATPTMEGLFRANLAQRTGCRDEGGDDWASFETLEWLDANVALLPAIDDVTGEHNRNLGHLYHSKGKSVDIRQFPTATVNLPSGLKNYITMRDDARQAMFGNSAALTRLDDWFTTNRQGLGDLLDTPGVAEIYVASSPMDNVLPKNWFYHLLVNGTAGSGADIVTLPSGPWTHSLLSNVAPRRGHLDHFHIGLE